MNANQLLLDTAKEAHVLLQKMVLGKINTNHPSYDNTSGKETVNKFHDAIVLFEEGQNNLPKELVRLIDRILIAAQKTEKAMKYIPEPDSKVLCAASDLKEATKALAHYFFEIEDEND